MKIKWSRFTQGGLGDSLILVATIMLVSALLLLVLFVRGLGVLGEVQERLMWGALVGFELLAIIAAIAVVVYRVERREGRLPYTWQEMLSGVWIALKTYRKTRGRS